MANRIVVFDPETMGAEAEEMRKRDEELKSLSLDHLFHRLWTKAVGTVDYVKAEWRELDMRLMPLRRR